MVDQIVVYVSIKHTERLAEAGLVPSAALATVTTVIVVLQLDGLTHVTIDFVSLAETINGFYKAEVIHRRGPWRSIEAVEFATLEWVDWPNDHRLLSSIVDLSSAEAEANYYASLEELKIAA